MKKIIILIYIIFNGINCFAHENTNHQNTLAKRIKFYPIYFNALQLNNEQISQFEYITDKYNNYYIENLNDTKALKRLSNNENKEIQKILDKRQKAQFRIIKHLERQDHKRSLKEKDYYKSNPRMSVFGDIQKK